MFGGGALAAGAAYLFLSDDESTSSLSSVPRGTDLVLSSGIDTLREDPGVRNTVAAWLSARSEKLNHPFERADVKWLEVVLEIGLAEFNQSTVFVQFNRQDATHGGRRVPFNPQFMGVILSGGITPENIKEGIEQTRQSVLEENEFSGQRIYRPEAEDVPLWVGNLSRQKTVVGTEDAVKNTVDIHHGGAAALRNDLDEAYSRSREGLIRFASRVPEPNSERYRAIPERHATVNYTPMAEIGTMYGSVQAEGSARVLNMTLETGDANSAKRVRDFLNEVRETYRDRRIQDAFQFGSSWLYDDIVQVVRDFAISQKGSEVALTVERDVSKLSSIVDVDRTIEDSVN